MYDPTRLYHIDFSDSQLPDEEIAERIEALERQNQHETDLAAKRKAKLFEFRFQGGML